MSDPTTELAAEAHDRPGFSGPLWWVLAVGAFVVAVAFALGTIAQNLESDLAATGGPLWDFRDASYYSVTAWLDGLVPYDQPTYFAVYPVAQEFGLLPPTYLVAHLPFQVFGFVEATTAIAVVNLLGSVALAAWALRLARYRATPVQILLASAVLIAGNAGRNVIYTGQSALLFTAGTYLALTASSMSAGSVGVFVAMIKPSFGLPVAFLLAAGGRVRRAVAGVAAAAIASVILMIPIVAAAGGMSPLIDILRENVAYSDGSQWIDLATATSRVDITATIAMLTNVDLGSAGELVLGLVVLGGAAWVLARRRAFQSPGLRDAAIVLVCVTTLLCIYHSFYDMVLLTLPLVLVVRRDFAGGIRPWVRWTLIASLVFAWFNPFRLNSIVWRLTDSLDVVQFLNPGLTGLALVVAFGAAIVAVLEAPKDGAVSGHSARRSIDSAQSQPVPYDGA